MTHSHVQEKVIGALDILAATGGHLQEHFRLPWSATVRKVVNCLRWNLANPKHLPLVAIVGGASSGKSTVFNNLLGGHLASFITARGHATRGPIMAVHERQRDEIERQLTGGLFPGLDRVAIELDGNSIGEPNQVSVVHHTVDQLRDVLLFDTPDFTSEAALLEGDVTLHSLPWFDAIIIVLDPERWFDRQSVSQLREASIRYGQRRYALFNRTQEGDIADSDLAQLHLQAERLSLEGSTVLEFRRGRGFCKFPPGTLDALHQFITSQRHERTTSLLQIASDAANDVLNQNEERRVRSMELRRQLSGIVERVVPTERDCMLALMTPDERRQIEVVWRVLRATDTREWINAQAQRLQKVIGQVPLVGSILSPSRVSTIDESRKSDRQSIAADYGRSVTQRAQHEISRAVRGSRFWHEIEAWTGMKAPAIESNNDAAIPAEIEQVTTRFDQALKAWNARVESECHGLTPNVKAGVGVGMAAVAVVLIAVPGPITALTFIAAKGAIAATLTHLAAASGAAALFGRQITRFMEVIREKAIGSPEFTKVQETAREFRMTLEAAARRIADAAWVEADALVLPESSEEMKALRQLCEVSER